MRDFRRSLSAPSTVKCPDPQPSCTRRVDAVILCSPSFPKFGAIAANSTFWHFIPTRPGADEAASQLSPPRLLCRSPGPGPSVSSLSRPKPHLSWVMKLTLAHTTALQPHTRPFFSTQGFHWKEGVLLAVAHHGISAPSPPCPSPRIVSAHAHPLPARRVDGHTGRRPSTGPPPSSLVAVA